MQVKFLQVVTFCGWLVAPADTLQHYRQAQKAVGALVTPTSEFHMVAAPCSITSTSKGAGKKSIMSINQQLASAVLFWIHSGIMCGHNRIKKNSSLWTSLHIFHIVKKKNTGHWGVIIPNSTLSVLYITAERTYNKSLHTHIYKVCLKLQACFQ